MTDKRKYICTPYVFIIAKRLVILSAEHERIRNTLRGETDCRAPCGVRNNSFFYRMKSPCDYTAIDFICLYLIMVKLFGLIIRLAGHIYTKLSEHLIVHARQNNA